MVKNMISLTVFKKNVSFIYLYLYTFFICINPSVFQSKLTIGTFFIQRIPELYWPLDSLGNKRSKNEVTILSQFNAESKMTCISMFFEKKLFRVNQKINKHSDTACMTQPRPESRGAGVVCPGETEGEGSGFCHLIRPSQTFSSFLIPPV